MNAYSNSLDRCRIMALRTPLQVDFSWINWLPGLLFGFVFSAANFSRKLQVFVFTLISTAVYFLAGLIFALFVSIIQAVSSEVWLALLLILGGLLSGFIGAFALALTGDSLARIPFILREDIIIAFAGALAGILFFGSFLLGILTYPIVLWSIGFLIWQVWVAILLSSRLQRPLLG